MFAAFKRVGKTPSLFRIEHKGSTRRGANSFSKEVGKLFGPEDVDDLSP